MDVVKEPGAPEPMRVTDITITDLHFSAPSTRHEGYVSMVLRSLRDGAQPMHLQFLCQANQPETCPSTIVMHDLISDALRQARRMPGFRRGEHAFEVEVSGARMSPRRASA